MLNLKCEQELFDKKMVDDLFTEKIFTWSCKVIASSSDINCAVLNFLRMEIKLLLWVTTYFEVVYQNLLRLNT